jgi:hypothetical protein
MNTATTSTCKADPGVRFVLLGASWRSCGVCGSIRTWPLVVCCLLPLACCMVHVAWCMVHGAPANASANAQKQDDAFGSHARVPMCLAVAWLPTSAFVCCMKIENENENTKGRTGGCGCGYSTVLM